MYVCFTSYTVDLWHGGSRPGFRPLEHVIFSSEAPMVPFIVKRTLHTHALIIYRIAREIWTRIHDAPIYMSQVIV